MVRSDHVLRPNLFIIGVPKAGTTSLTEWLCRHPMIIGSYDQELRFLMDDKDPLSRPDGFARHGLGGYSRHYPRAASSGPNMYILDATPQYYYQETARKAIPSFDDSQVIFSLRNPAERILSLFRYAQNNMAVIPADLSFSEFLDHVRMSERSDLLRNRVMLRNAITHSHYAPYVEDWCKLIGSDRVHLLHLEDMVENPAREMRKLAEALMIDTAHFDCNSFASSNESFTVKSQSIHRLARRTKNSVPGWARRKLMPIYMQINTSRKRRELDDKDRRAFEDLVAEFGDWRAALPATGPSAKGDSLWLQRGRSPTDP